MIRKAESPPIRAQRSDRDADAGAISCQIIEVSDPAEPVILYICHEPGLGVDEYRPRDLDGIERPARETVRAVCAQRVQAVDVNNVDNCSIRHRAQPRNAAGNIGAKDFGTIVMKQTFLSFTAARCAIRSDAVILQILYASGPDLINLRRMRKVGA